MKEYEGYTIDMFGHKKSSLHDVQTAKKYL